MIYTVTFNPAIDYVVRADSLTLGAVIRVHSEEIYFGGKGINVSTVLHNLGVHSTALGFVAGFTGRALEESVRASGVQTDFITLPAGNTRINMKIKAEQETDINAAGPAIPPEAVGALFDKLKTLRDGDILVLAGSIPSSLPQDMYERILDAVSDREIESVVDATGDLLVNVLKYHPFLIKPNHHELAEIFGQKALSLADIEVYAGKLRRMGAKNVLVSMAGDGAMLLTERGECLQIGVPKGEVKNSVGAGDSMVAGFLTGFLEKKDYAYALKMGTATGSATAFSDGLATREKVEELFQII